MIDYDTKLRTAYFNVLDGNLTALTVNVPVVDEKLDPGNADVYVKIGSQNDKQENNKHHWAASCMVNVDVIQRTLSVGSKIVVDDVAGQIMTALFPTKNTHTLTVASPLRLTYAHYEGSQTEPLKAIESGFIIVKRLSFTNRVTQDA